MNITKITTIIAALSASLLLNATAQNATPTAAPAAPAATATPDAGGNGGGNNAQDWRARMNDRMKTALKATDDEWKVLQPLIETVVEKQRATRGGFGGGGPGGPGGRRGGGNGGPGGNGGNGGGNPPPQAGPTPIGAAEAQALRTALDSDATTPDEIKAKLAALRDARKKAAAELETAREELKKVLTLRQEAVLVNFGLLE